jgi:hypothetical protein
VLILKVEGAGEDETVEILPLSDIPESEVEQIQDGIAFIKKEQAEGNNDATGEYGFNHSGDWNTFVNYRITLRNSAGARKLRF